MIAVKFLLGLIVLVFLVTFAVQNMEPQITIHYFSYELGPLPFFFSLLAAAVIGMVIAAAYSVIEQLKLSSIIRQQKRRIQAVEKELLDYQQRPPEPLKELDSDETMPMPTGGP